MGRLILLVIVMLGLAPGTWWRVTAAESSDERQILHIVRLPVEQGALGTSIEVEGAWELSSPNHHFSGYSALVPFGDGTLLALSDHAQQLRFSEPGSPDRSVEIGYFAVLADADKRQLDLEAAARDPQTGQIWAAYEYGNFVERYSAGFVPERREYPPAMEHWPRNAGPEAMARLADGRFVILSEGNGQWFSHEVPGMLFPDDPLEHPKGTQFRFRPPRGFAPVDMAELPDGRVLILLRTVRWGMPPRFEGQLVVADPADITSGEPWRWRKLADLAPPLPMDNYEGLAVEPQADGHVVLWLISDDNKSAFQRTLLLKLSWRPNKKGAPVAPRAF